MRLTCHGLLAVIFCTFLACRSEPTDDTPTGALRLFLSAMDRSAVEEDALRQAYDLLAEESRNELMARAREATVLSGKRLDPWSMMVQGRFRMRFAPVRMQESQEGDKARVVVMGPDDQRSEITLKRESGKWRVLLELPSGED